MAASAGLFKRPANNEPHDWIPLVSKQLAKTPDPHAVVREIVYRLRPRSWSGSLAAKLEGRLRLLERLSIDQNAGLADALAKAKADMQEWIARERKSELAESRARGGRPGTGTVPTQPLVSLPANADNLFRGP